MNYYKYIVSTLILGMCTLTTNAQVPGYLGKRFAIGYAPSLMPFFPKRFDFKSTDGSSLRDYAINVKHRLDLNYVIKEHVSLSLDYSFQKWGVISNLNNEGNLIGTDNSRLEKISETFGVSDFQYIYATSNKFTLSFIKTDQGVAPRGRYFAIGISYENIQPKMVDLKGNAINLDAINDYGLNVRLGKRRVFFDKIMVDAALSFETSISTFSRQGDYNPEYRDFGYNGLLDKDELSKHIANQAARHTLVSLRLGIYYLL